VSFYQIKQLGRKVARQSMTAPVRGTLEAVLKQDSDNSPCCVYNELVALRLGQRLGVPLAMGVPSVGDGGVYFASLTVGGLSINLPDLSNKKMANVADRYPKEAAAIFVFDVWILNDDREYMMCQHFSGHKFKQPFAGFQNQPANDSHLRNGVVPGCKKLLYIQIQAA